MTPSIRCSTPFVIRMFARITPISLEPNRIRYSETAIFNSLSVIFNCGRTYNYPNVYRMHTRTHTRTNERTHARRNALVPSYLTRDLTRFAIQAKGPDGKWTRKPLAYRESISVRLRVTRPSEICVQLLFKHIHAASGYTIRR